MRCSTKNIILISLSSVVLFLIAVVVDVLFSFLFFAYECDDNIILFRHVTLILIGLSNCRIPPTIQPEERLKQRQYQSLYQFQAFLMHQTFDCTHHIMCFAHANVRSIFRVYIHPPKKYYDLSLKNQNYNWIEQIKSSIQCRSFFLVSLSYIYYVSDTCIFRNWNIFNIHNKHNLPQMLATHKVTSGFRHAVEVRSPSQSVRPHVMEVYPVPYVHLGKPEFPADTVVRVSCRSPKAARIESCTFGTLKSGMLKRSNEC